MWPEFCQFQQKYKILAHNNHQMLPLQIANVSVAELTTVGIYNRGVITYAIALNCIKNDGAGAWVGIKCETYVSRTNTVVASRKSKLHFVHVGKTLKIEMRIWPSEMFSGNTSSYSQYQKIAQQRTLCKIIVTMSEAVEREEMQTFLAKCDTCVSSIPWPLPTGRSQLGGWDYVVRFTNWSYVLSTRATLLAKLDRTSPVHLSILNHPHLHLYEVPLRAKSRVTKVVSSFLNSGYIPEGSIHLRNIYEVLVLVKCLHFDALLNLCAVRLVQLLRADMVDRRKKRLLTNLNLPLITGLIKSHTLSLNIHPAIAN